MDKWCAAIFGILCLIICWVSIIKSVKESNRSAPYGKVFKREFNDTIERLHRACNYNKDTDITLIVKTTKFKVKVDEYKPLGLEYSTIPMYKCYDVYINDELVCKEHIIKDLCEDKIWFEFSSKRKRDEIIDIVNATKDIVREILKQSDKKLYERLGLTSKSFFEYSFNNETGDM